MGDGLRPHAITGLGHLRCITAALAADGTSLRRRAILWSKTARPFRGPLCTLCRSDCRFPPPSSGAPRCVGYSPYMERSPITQELLHRVEAVTGTPVEVITDGSLQ